jgi:hypothetical protein
MALVRMRRASVRRAFGANAAVARRLPDCSAIPIYPETKLCYGAPGRGNSMKTKIILLAIAIAAVLVGFALPTPGADRRAQSQFATLEVGG